MESEARKMFDEARENYILFLATNKDTLRETCNDRREIVKLKSVIDSFNVVPGMVVAIRTKDSVNGLKTIACKLDNGLTGFFQDEQLPARDRVGSRIYVLKHEKRVAKDSMREYVKVLDWSFEDPLVDLKSKLEDLSKQTRQYRVGNDHLIGTMNLYKSQLKSINEALVYEKKTGLAFESISIISDLGTLDDMSIFSCFATKQINAVFYEVLIIFSDEENDEILHVYTTDKSGDNIHYNGNRKYKGKAAHDELLTWKNAKIIYGSLPNW